MTESTIFIVIRKGINCPDLDRIRITKIYTIPDTDRIIEIKKKPDPNLQFLKVTNLDRFPNPGGKYDFLHPIAFIIS